MQWMVSLLGDLKESYGYCCAVIAIVSALVLLEELSTFKISFILSRSLMAVQENL